MVEFQPGHRYADFNSTTDKVASYGLAALVADWWREAQAHQVLPLDDRWHDRVGQLWFAVVALQLGLWGQEAVARLLQDYYGSLAAHGSTRFLSRR